LSRRRPVWWLISWVAASIVGKTVLSGAELVARTTVSVLTAAVTVLTSDTIVIVHTTANAVRAGCLGVGGRRSGCDTAGIIRHGIEDTEAGAEQVSNIADGWIWLSVCTEW
jgi:hypothetical protein